MREKLLRWALFSVTLALVPLIVSGFILSTRGQPADVTKSLSVRVLDHFVVGVDAISSFAEWGWL